MSDNKKYNNVSEKELDNLLNQAFLNLDFTNPKNKELMETISQQVLQPKSVYINFNNKSFITKLIGALVLISTGVIIYFAFFKKTSTNLTSENNPVKESIIKQDIKPNVPKQKDYNILLISENKENNQKQANTVSEHKPEETIFPISSQPINQEKPELVYVDENKNSVEDSTYVFPKLTEKEIKETKRQKEIMAMMLVKPNKNWYPFIGPKQNKTIYGLANDTSSAFYMARAEVTNLEYRTFLFDLLIHEKKAEFLKAKPHQDFWLNAGNQTNGRKMKEDYFANKKYNDYPVVNITPEGAELYCKWLASFTESEEYRLVIRLPYESEWEKAARSTKTVAAYPWGTDSIQNKNGCHLANFCIKKQSEQLRTLMDCKPKNPNAYNSAEFMLGDSMMTTKVYSYNPNDYGLYCIIGNVAEMVYDNKTKDIKTKGGSWNSSFEQCKIYNHEELTGAVKANPMTGFRPVFRMVLKNNFGSIERDDPQTGLTTFSESEIKKIEKEKKKMIDALIKYDKSTYSLIPMGTCVYKKDTVSVQSFYMRTTEITNLEYRTFLADLLIQKREADYLIAKPDQNMWVKKFPYSYNEPMKNLYFWHPAYDEYPVVNISQRAAEMYCEWLTVETNKTLKVENKPLINDLRIPVDIEWAYAASNKKNHVKYANGNDLLRDSKGKYEMNFLCYTKEQCRFDTVMKLYVPKKGVKANNGDDPSLFEDGGFHTVYTKSYQPNSYGLYCMAGNVSEMVKNFDLKTKKIVGKGTKGGSWFSCDYFLEIDADEEYPGETGPSPLIGFRPVITVPKAK